MPKSPSCDTLRVSQCLSVLLATGLKLMCSPKLPYVCLPVLKPAREDFINCCGCKLSVGSFVTEAAEYLRSEHRPRKLG